MARTVFTNDMVAHVWAQQEQEHGRSSNGNFYFRGPTIYSYRDAYPVGHFVTCPDGKPAVLLWSGSYSVTTSGHQSMARAAVRHVRSFAVPDLLVGHRGDIEARAVENARILNEGLKASIEQLMKSARNPRMSSRLYMVEYGHMRDQSTAVQEYCKAFRLKCPEPAKSYTDEATRAEYNTILDAAKAAAAARLDKHLSRFNGDREALAAHNDRRDLLARANRTKTPNAHYTSWRDRERINSVATDLSRAHAANPSDETIARHHARFAEWRAQDAARRLAEQERQEQYQRERERQQALTAERRAAFDAMGPLQQRDACLSGNAQWSWLDADARLDMWREGLSVPRHSLPYASNAALRLNGHMVETSQGANFLAEHARRAWRFLRVLYQRGEAWQANGRTIKLGHFAITRVDADGTITAGCHRVTRSEVERLAAALSLAPVSVLPAGMQEALPEID